MSRLVTNMEKKQAFYYLLEREWKEAWKNSDPSSMNRVYKELCYIKYCEVAEQIVLYVGGYEFYHFYRYQNSFDLLKLTQYYVDCVKKILQGYNIKFRIEIKQEDIEKGVYE